MSRFDGFLRWAGSILIVCTMAFALGGCEGDDGAAGAAGATGPIGPIGPAGPPAPIPDVVAAAIESASVESCATCHDGVGDGLHQAVYNQYADTSTFALTIDGLTSVADGGGRFDVTLDFSITHNGVPFIDAAGLSPSVDSISFYVVEYDSVADEFLQPGFSPFPSMNASLATSNGDGSYTLMQNVEYDPVNFESGAIIGQLGDGKFDFPDNPGTSSNHLAMFNDLSHASYAIGNIGTWDSAANVSGCESCHGAPYRKHGNVEAVVAGMPDFARCKTCHFDNRTGGHTDWQYMVDEPFNWATEVAETADYSYTANVMNVTHMSHAMEFPYPMSASNCATCHEGKLNQILADEQFTVETCKSCHAVQGLDAWPKTYDAAGDEILDSRGRSVPGKYYQAHRAPALEYLWTADGVEGFHDTSLDCALCHKPAVDGGVAPTFNELHTGYDVRISDPSGQRYADFYTVSIDQVTMSNNLLTINFSSSDPTILPEVLVSLYGWDSKHFIVASHTRDGSDLCPSSRGDGCRMEWAPGDTSPLFTEDSASVPGNWMVTLDFAAYQPTAFLTDDIPTMILNGDVKMAEITVTPELTLNGVELGLNAVTQTFELGTSLLVSDYFKAANASVDTNKCNTCHDQLAVTFHGGSGRGGDIVACKNCHLTTTPGSHLEMASRSIESYVHAIHSFQPFDLDDVVADNDPVELKRTAMHKEHTFPNFTITNCEGCHIAGTYNVPDQAKSMPGVLSASWAIADRNIGTVAETVTGPASRACGGCHRADLINADLAGDLASFNAHTEAFGTLEENDAEDLILFGIIDKIMSMFE